MDKPLETLLDFIPFEWAFKLISNRDSLEIIKEELDDYVNFQTLL
ncbi:hypothetical protein [Aquirufa echingensis]|mgnify:CR=1 FL=1